MKTINIFLHVKENIHLGNKYITNIITGDSDEELLNSFIELKKRLKYELLEDTKFRSPFTNEWIYPLK